MNARINTPRKVRNTIVSKSNSTPEAISMTTKTALVTRNDVQGSKAEAYRAAEKNALHAGETMFGDRSYRTRTERNGRPLVSDIQPAPALPLRKPADGLVSQFEYDEEKQYGYLYVSYGKSYDRKERDAHRNDTKYSDLRLAKGALNVLRLALTDDDLHYGGGIMTRYANQITENSGYFKTAGAVAYVKGCDVGRLMTLTERGVRGNGWLDMDFTYKVSIGHDGALVINDMACSNGGSKTSPEGFEMQFVIYQTLEDGNGVLVSVGPETHDKAFAIHSYVEAMNKLDDTRLSEKAVEAVQEAATDVYSRLVSDRYAEKAGREAYRAQKSTERKVINNLSAPTPIEVSSNATSLFNGEQVHFTAALLREEIAAGRPIIKYGRTAEILEAPAGWSYTDLRRQSNLDFIASTFNAATKVVRKSVPAWK